MIYLKPEEAFKYLYSKDRELIPSYYPYINIILIIIMTALIIKNKNKT